MPELPEVETVARGLQKSVAGRRILSVTLRKTDFIDDPGLIERALPGCRIERVERYGKFMLLRLGSATGIAQGDNSEPTYTNPRGRAKARHYTADEPQKDCEALLVHLGMTGNLAPNHAEEPLDKHTHVIFSLDDGRELRYTDARRFGRMAYLSGNSFGEELQRFGADPLEVEREEFSARMRSSKARIKALLLDQRVLRGVGNIYADESLWRARIHPVTPGARLLPQQAEKLRKALKDVLLHAIAKNGSSISDFVDSNGQSGSYQNYHRAYGREGKPCYRCGATIRRIIVAGRSSHFCPRCQPAPRRAGRAAKRVKRKRPSRASKT